MTNQELRTGYENRFLDQKKMNQIQKDIHATANSEGRCQDDPAFLEDFWANYCPEDDGNEWVRRP